MSMYHALKISVLITSVLSVSSCTDHPLIQKNGRISSFNDIEQQNLLNHVELFIEFLEQHRHLITDKKIFGISEVAA